MRYFAITLPQMVIRFYLMIAVVLIGMFSGLYWLCILALPIFLSTLLGVSFKSTTPARKKPTKVVPLPPTTATETPAKVA